MIRPGFGTTWRFAFSIFWKFSAVMFVVAAVVQFLGYLTPFEQIEYWMTGVSYRAFSDFGITWLSPTVLKLVWSVALTAVSFALQFVLFNALVAAHVGKRFKSTEVVIREVR